MVWLMSFEFSTLYINKVNWHWFLYDYMWNLYNIKINVDAAVSIQQGVVVVGCVAHNNNGDALGSITWRFVEIESVLYVNGQAS